MSDERQPRYNKRMHQSASLRQSLFPETYAGGYSRYDQKVNFYTRVKAILEPSFLVVEIGAGRGRWVDTMDSFRRDLMMFKGKCKRIIGIDVDAAVLENTSVDEALVIRPKEKIPIADNSVDMIVAWAVFEHVEDPSHFSEEVKRILRPGGWLCAWTPNKWGYVGIGARLLPNTLHARLLRIIAPGDTRQDSDVFRTYYRMNTMYSLRRLFPPEEFIDASYTWNGPPVYHMNSRLLAIGINAYGNFVPSFLRQSLFVFMRRRQSS